MNCNNINKKIYFVFVGWGCYDNSNMCYSDLKW